MTAQEMAAKRWANVTPEQRAAHGAKMRAARDPKRLRECLDAGRVLGQAARRKKRLKRRKKSA